VVGELGGVDVRTGVGVVGCGGWSGVMVVCVCLFCLR